MGQIHKIKNYKELKEIRERIISVNEEMRDTKTKLNILTELKRLYSDKYRNISNGIYEETQKTKHQAIS